MEAVSGGVRLGSVLVFSVLVSWLAAAQVQVGPGSQLEQGSQGTEINFSEPRNFSGLSATPSFTVFEGSRFVASPETGVDLVLDLYDPGAARQDFVTNISAEAGTSQRVNFSVDGLPGEDFYEVFLRDGDGRQTSDRLKIGFTNSSGEFNFSDTLSDRNYSLWYYGEKGVEISNVSFNRSDFEPVEREPVGVNQTITNEGAVEDEAVNKTLRIQTFNGTDWKTVEYISTDIGVPIKNTETQQEFISRFRGSFTNTTQYRGGGGQVGLGYQNGTAGDDLVGYWRMDQAVSGTGGTVEDYSGEGLEGTTREGVNTGSSGILNTFSFNFKESTGDRVVVSNDPALNSADEITMSAWVKLDTVPTSDHHSGILTKWATEQGTRDAHYYLFFHKNARKFTFGWENGGFNGVRGNFTPQAGKWYHVVGRINSDTNQAALFINGTKQKEVSSENGLADANSDIAIGNTANNIWPLDGSVDEARIYTDALTDAQIKDLYFHGAPFRGSYTTEEIQEGELTNWYRVNLDANVPGETELDAEFRALDSNSNLVDSKSFSVKNGDRFYDLSNMPDTERAEIRFNGTSENLTKSWELDSLQVISGGPYLDSFDARAGPFLANVSLDPEDEVKETNESNNDAVSGILNIDSYEFLFGGTSFQKFLADSSGNRFFTWNPSNADGNIFVADKDLSFVPTELEPLGEGNYSAVDRELNMTGHNDSVSELWDPDGDGQAEETESFDIGGSAVSVPVTNSTDGNDGNFTTGVMYDASQGSPYDGTQALVFVSEVRPGTSGGFSGSYDYEVRVPFSLGRQVSGVDEVGIVSEVR